MSLLLEYQTKLSGIQAGIALARSVQPVTLAALFGALVLLLVLGIRALEQKGPAWAILVPVPVAVAAARRYGGNRAEWSRLTRLEHFYQNGLARLEDRFTGLGFSGEEFQITGHRCEPDLGMFGPGSLFERICTARTEIGRRRLAEYLVNAPELTEANSRQEAVRELALRPWLREQIAVLGKFDFQESRGKTFADWLNAPVDAPGIGPRLVALVSSASLTFLFLYTYVAQPLVMQSWIHAAPWLAAVAVIESVIAAIFHSRAKIGLASAMGVGLEIGVVRSGIGLIQTQEFQSEKLRNLKAELSRGNASQCLSRLEMFTRVLDTARHPFFEIPARAIILRTQVWFALERWKLRNGESFRRWLAAWAEFEALAALAGYAYEHRDHAFPEFVEGGAVLEARDLGHPMLPRGACVRNTVEFGTARSFYIIGGSNMAGKSTLLRAIGLNVALAYAGAPVTASAFRISKLSVCASLSIVDSLRDGRSKFMAEMDKIRHMMELARAQGNVLFLIDEILAGTNSKDRGIATEAIVRGLVEQGAIGAISTHDLALTQIAGIVQLRGTNVHMGSRAGAGPLEFDYLLKPGITQESNALAIAKLAGVIP